MSGFDANPFSDPFASNPFADPAVTRVTNQAGMSQPTLDDYNPFADQQKSQQQPQQTQKPPTTTVGTLPQYTTPKASYSEPSQPAVMQPIAEPPPAYTPTGAHTLTSEDLQRKQEELERKAAELQAKEEALKQGNFNARANNWPPLPKSFCVGPCFYQDISLEIPLEFQKMVKTMYYMWMYYVVLLFLNMLGGLALLFTGSGYGTLFGFSILAFVLFSPLSFVCWFRPLYKAFRSDSSFNFMVFFFIFFFQFVLGVIFAVGIPSFGSCGFIVGFTAMSDNKAAGILALLLAVLHSLFAAASFFMLLRIHRIYRNTGASFAKAQQEFTSGVLHNEHVQSAATTAVTSATRQAMAQQFSGNRY